MRNIGESIPVGVQGLVVRTLLNLPHPIQRLLAGKPVVGDGQELSVEVQLLLRLQRLTGNGLRANDAPTARRRLRRAIGIVGGDPIQPIELHEFGFPGPGGTLRARLYTPENLPAGSPLLVYFHGGGWVVGDLDSHDNLCRFLAKHSGVRVLSVDYRCAPEAPFPAAVDDAIAAFDYAIEHAESWGADPSAIALGGDSAGGNLAAVVAHQASLTDRPKPAFLLLFYPAVDASRRRRSRELFGEGLLLSDDEITWFIDQYCPDVPTRLDPRLSVLLADDLTGLPATYVATAGFDPLRDEGEDFAARLTASDVPVVLRRHDDLVHGFADILGVGRVFREAVHEAAGALRAGLSLRKRSADPLRDAASDVG